MRDLDNILNKIEAEHPYKVPGDSSSYNQYNEGWCDCLDRVRLELKDVNDGWIPVEERLPEKFSIGVEVTTKDLERNIARYAKPPMDMWISVYTGRTLDVIAWKEPSESYHPEGLETRKEIERRENENIKRP